MPNKIRYHKTYVKLFFTTHEEPIKISHRPTPIHSRGIVSAFHPDGIKIKTNSIGQAGQARTDSEMPGAFHSRKIYCP